MIVVSHFGSKHKLGFSKLGKRGYQYYHFKELKVIGNEQKIIIIVIQNHSETNLVPRALRLFGQWMGARRDSGELEVYLNFLIGCPATA